VKTQRATRLRVVENARVKGLLETEVRKFPSSSFALCLQFEQQRYSSKESASTLIQPSRQHPSTSSTTSYSGRHPLLSSSLLPPRPHPLSRFVQSLYYPLRSTFYSRLNPTTSPFFYNKALIGTGLFSRASPSTSVFLSPFSITSHGS